VLAFAALVTTVVLLGSATGRWRVVPVLSGSMDPALRTGDVAVVVPQNVADVRVGQVVVYQIPIGDRHLEMHRIVRVTSGPRGTDVVTAGDANRGWDPWTARLQGSMVWRVAFRVRWLGYVVLFLGRPEVRIACLLAGVGMLLGLGLRWIWGVVPSTDKHSSTGAVDVDS